jgi:hypothetical protein
MDLDLPFKTTFAREQLEEGLKRWPTSIAQCCQRAQSFKTLKTLLTQNSEDSKAALESLSKLAEQSNALEPLLRESTEVEKEGYEQVCWTGTPWSQLNSVPFALLIFSFYKAYVVPGFSLLLPLISVVLPFVFLKLFYTTIPITLTEYLKIIWRVWNGHPMPRSPQELLAPPPESTAPTNVATQLKGMVQNGWTLFTLGQAMWQPIQQARHHKRLDADCVRLGSAVICVKGEVAALSKRFAVWIPGWLSEMSELCPSDSRQAFAFALENPWWLRHVLRAVGRFDVLFTLASRADTVATEFIGGQKPVLVLRDFGDPAIPLERRVLSSVSLGARGQAGHAIVTGPNRGGKSSFLRGVCVNVQVSHAFGCAFAGRAQMTRFAWIADGLRLGDEPGETSMFEREVAFASGVLQKKTSAPGLVLYDELFHSTNPPDAIRTSEQFCSELWAKTNCISLISTHVYSLARSAPADRVKPLCIAAWRTGPGGSRFVFSYSVKKGICEVSSVDLLLRQYRLVP